jgi:hypothetical protein
MSELDDLVRNRRFDEIHEARRQVIDDERSINEALATDQIGDDQARRLFQRAVDAYVRELEYLLNPPHDDGTNEYWHETDIGSIRRPGNNEPLVVTGLGEYLALPEDIPYEIEQVAHDRYDQLGGTATVTVTVQPSWQLLRRAFRIANAAVADLGLELDISEDDDTWRFRKIEDIDDINPEEWNDLSVFQNGNGPTEEVPE